MNVSDSLKKGRYCEEKALIFFQKAGWKLISKNQLWAGVEVDLIMENSDFYLLVEVKSDNSWRREYPMSRDQKKRLYQAFSVFCEQHNKPVKTLLAIVNQKETITFDLEF